MAKLPAFAVGAPKSFSQPHPLKNLAHYAHLPKDNHVTTKVPRPQRDTPPIATDKPNFKPAATPRFNTRTSEKSVAGPDMGTSDIKSEGIGMDLGPTKANVGSAPPAYRPIATPKKQMKKAKTSTKGTPFFGSMN